MAQTSSSTSGSALLRSTALKILADVLPNPASGHDCFTNWEYFFTGRRSLQIIKKKVTNAIDHIHPPQNHVTDPPPRLIPTTPIHYSHPQPLLRVCTLLPLILRLLTQLCAVADPFQLLIPTTSTIHRFCSLIIRCRLCSNRLQKCVSGCQEQSFPYTRARFTSCQLRHTCKDYRASIVCLANAWRVNAATAQVMRLRLVATLARYRNPARTSTETFYTTRNTTPGAEYASVARRTDIPHEIHKHIHAQSAASEDTSNSLLKN